MDRPLRGFQDDDLLKRNPTENIFQSMANVEKTIYIMFRDLRLSALALCFDILPPERDSPRLLRSN